MKRTPYRNNAMCANGCEKRAQALGVCAACYQRQRRPRMTVPRCVVGKQHEWTTKGNCRKCGATRNP